MIEFKEASLEDLDDLYQIETTCFLKAEAASYESLRSRLEVYSHGYDLLYVDGKAAGYIGGLKNNEMVLPDEMYHDSSMHCTDGKYQLIFSVCVLPVYQRKGYASKMVQHYIEYRKEEVDGFVLTCKDHLIPFYTRCGFEFEKVSNSTHGNAKWNDMILKIC